MSKASHVECPHCRAPIGVSELSRIVRCRHCDGKLLVDGHEFIGEYYAKARVDRTAARRAIQRSLSDKLMPRDLLRRSRLDTARLYFVPYNQVFARRVGKVITKGKGGALADDARQATAAKTRVIITDFAKTAPATDPSDWGLSHTLIAGTADPPFELSPANRETMSGEGRVRPPTKSPETMLTEQDQGRTGAMFMADTEYIERRYRRIYYPIWRIGYRYRRRYYWASVDGISGGVVSLRAPESDRNRLKWLLGTGLFVAVVLGKIIRTIFDVMDRMGAAGLLSLVTHPLSLLGGFFVLALLALIANVGWEQFRYPGELVFSGNSREVIKLNKSGDTAVLRFIMKTLNTISEQLNTKRRPPF